MTGIRKSKRDMAMSNTMKVIRNAHPGIPQTQVLTMASKQLSGKNKTGGILPILPLGIGALAGLIDAKIVGRVLSIAPPRGKGMYLKPYRWMNCI